MNKPLPLVVEDISFRYRDRPEWAIRQVSFSLEPGEVLLVAGASGCGKTTLARCLNGLIPHSYKGELQGSITLQGRETRAMSLSEVSQVVGTVLQDPERQIVGSSVLAEVAFGPENLGLPREEIQARIDEVLRRLGIAHLKQRETFALSGGEKQKVVLAGVLAMRPSILLLDEPLASLDPASAREALALFRSLADEGTSILLIEHRVEDALQARPDRLLYMRDSQVHYLGPIKELPAEVNHREVKLPAPWLIRRLKESGEPLPEPPPPVSPSGEPLAVFEDVLVRLPRWPARAARHQPAYSPGRPDRRARAERRGKIHAGQTCHRPAQAHARAGAGARKGYPFAFRGPDCAHAGLCLPKPRAHAVCRHGPG